jgi:hypothetical protein
VTYTSPIAGATGERWQVTSSDSGTYTAIGSVSSSTTSTVEYYHQFKQTLSYSVVGGGSPSAPTASGMEFGLAYVPSLTTSASPYWFDASGSTAFSTSTGGTGERWAPSPATVSATSSNTQIVSMYHQYYLTVAGGNSPTGQGWYNSGSTANPSNAWIWGTSGSTRSALTNWQLDGISQNPSRSDTGNLTLSVTMSTYHTVNFVSTTQYYLTVNGGNSVTFGTASPTGDQWYDSGGSTTVSSNGVYSRSGGTGQRVASWNLDGGSNTAFSSTGTVTTSSVSMSTYHTVNFNSVTQYQVTLDSGATSALSSITLPTVSGDNYWYDSGTSVTLVLNGVYGRGSGTGTRVSGYQINAGSNNPESTTGTFTVLNAISISGVEAITTTTVTQYQVTFVVSPSGSGSTSPAGTNVWEDTGSLGISTTANSGYSFSTWSSNTTSITFATANSADTTATINGSGTITATFTPTTTTTYTVTFTQTGLPAGKSWSVTFNSVTQSSTTSTIVFKGIASGSYSWSLLTPVAGSTGIRYQASQASGTMNVPSQTTQRITYTTQFYLTVSANFGSVSPSSGWYVAGSKVTLSATSPNAISGERYVFNGWTGTGCGSYTGTRNPASNVVTMDGPITEVASWIHQYQVTVTASPCGAIGGTFEVTYAMSGTTYTDQLHNTPWTQWTDASTTVTVSSPQSPYKGYTFSSYTNNPTNMNSPQTITLIYYGALNHFVFNTIGTQTAGKAFSITITAKDAYGNTVKNYAGSTTLTETGGGAGGTVSPSLVTFTNGVYTGNAYVTKSGTGVTITATYGSTSSASNMFTVNPGALSTFVFNTIGTQTAGKAFSITITAKDAYGNTVTSFASSVGLSASTGGGTITPASTGTTGWLNGVWTGSVTLNKASLGVAITANDGSGHTGSSNPFTVRT